MQLRLFKRWGKAFGEILRAVDHLPAKKNVSPRPNYHAAASRARAILERIRRGEYEFSSVEITEILKHNNWLGCRQSWFESVEATGDGMVEVRLQVPMLGKVSLLFLILDLWHDQRVSSIDFQIRGLSVEKWRNRYLRYSLEFVLTRLIYAILWWKGSWAYESLQFVLRVKRTIRLYVDWPEKQSPLLGNISVLGIRVQKDSVIFYTFRRPAEQQSGFGLSMSGGNGEVHPSAWSRLAVVFSWILLGAYAFVLVHVTLPVLSGAFKLIPQDATGLHIWVLTQIYNLCVMLLSYFFLRITMLPLYLKWNKSKEDLATLVSLEERDHQYLRPLTELVRKMQQAGKSSAWRESAVGDVNVDTGTIAQMIDLMSTIREQSQQRLLGMTRMRRGWVQDLLIGYFFIFSLEWMYYKGVLTPLSVSIKWVNRIMVGLFLTE